MELIEVNALELFGKKFFDACGKSIILMSPFSSMENLVNKFFPFVSYFEGNILLLHGKNDFIIPNSESEIIFNSAISASKNKIVFDEIGHRNMFQSSEIMNRIYYEIIK